jgi:myosin X
LNSVKGRTVEEINEMLAQASINPRHAEGTIELDDILSVGPTNTVDVEGHPSFVVMSADRLYKFVAQNEAEMDEWCRLLTPKRREGGDGDDGHVIERGWMMKAGGKQGNQIKRRRWFVLKGDVISYYKAKGEVPVGTIPLNALSSVIPPDEEKLQKNDYTFICHSKIKSFHLTCKTQADCNRWINAIQDVIDNCPVIQTPMERLIEELRMASASETDQIYQTHKVLTYSSVPLQTPMLPLPYGNVSSASGSRTYESLNAEALKISAALLPSANDARNPYGAPSDPVKLIKSILQVCFDVHRLRNEVYCQIVSQTTNAPNPGSALNMTHWHLLACLCCSFLPSRKLQRFIRYHLTRTVGMKDRVGEQVVEMAQFCLEALKHNKIAREFPPSTREIEAIMSGKGLHCTVSCVGGR